MRFNTPEEVIVWAENQAKITLEGYVFHNCDINPYSTDMARHEWQLGFNGKPLNSSGGHPDYNTAYHIGCASRRLAKRYMDYCKMVNDLGIEE